MLASEAGWDTIGLNLLRFILCLVLSDVFRLVFRDVFRFVFRHSVIDRLCGLVYLARWKGYQLTSVSKEWRAFA